MEKVGKYMTHEVFMLNPNDSLAKARNAMLTKKIGKSSGQKIITPQESSPG